MIFNPHIKLYNNALLTALLLMLLMIGCSPENDEPITNITLSDKAVFTFGQGSLEEQSVTVTQLRSASINTGELDKVNKIRIIAPEKNLNDIFSTENNTNPTYIYEELTDGEECAFYFIANEKGDEGYATANSAADVEALLQKTKPFFTKDVPAEHNVMTSKYTVKREGNGYKYRRDYPKPETAFTDVAVANYNGVPAYGIPVLLYPIYSRFNISIEWPTDNDPDFTKENNGQEIYFDFIDFPEKMKIFGGTVDATTTDNVVHTHGIDLAADFQKPNLSYSLFFPATSTAKEKVHLRYSFDGKEHTILVKPKETTLFDLNTQYKLPIKVFINKEYDVWIEKLYTVEKNSLVSVDRKVGDYEIYDEGKNAQIHMGVPHNYRTVAVLKSRLAPAEFKISDTEGVYWITRETELLDKREVFFEEDIPYYRQYFVLSYDVDNENQVKPLISSFQAYNTKDETKTASLEASFNILSRYAKMNLGELNKFSNGNDTELGIQPNDPKNEGKLYQFGRNVPFEPYTGWVNKKDEILELYDERIWNGESGVMMKYQGHYSTKRKGSPINIYTWWKRPDDEPERFYRDTVPEEYADWKSLINTQHKLAKEKGVTMPDSYFGNNGGDPCPPGYRIPSMYDFNSIYYNDFVPGVFSGNYNFLKKTIHVAVYGTSSSTSKTVDETRMNPSGNPAVQTIRQTTIYKADYIKGSGGAVYALRFKGTQFASAFRYKKLWTGAVEISCMPLKDNSTTIHDIKNESFWTDTDNIRYVETTYFHFNHGTYASNVEGLQYGIPDLWTGTSLAYGAAMDIDLLFSSATKHTGTQVCILPIRCMRE